MQSLPDGRLVTPYEVGIEVWDIDTPEDPLRLAGPTEFTDFVVPLPDGSLATAATDDILRLWRIDGPQARSIDEVRIPDGVDIRGLVELDRGRVATVGYEKYVHVWDTADLSAPTLTLEHDEPLYRAEQLPDGRLAVLTQSSTVYVWDLDDPATPLLLGSGSDEFTFRVGMLSDGTIYAANQLGVTQLFSESADQMPSSDNRWHTQEVSDIVWLTDGRLASTGVSGEMFVWDLSGRRPPLELIGHEAPITMITEHRGSLVSASTDGTIRQWDLQNGGETTRITTGQPVLAAQVLPDGAVAFGATDGTLRISQLNEADGLPLLVDGSMSPVREMRLLGDGRMLTTNDDHQVIVWNTNTWQPAFTYSGHDSTIGATEELPDGRLITVDEDGGVHVWDPYGSEPPTVTNTGEPIRMIEIAGQDRFVTTTGDGTATAWDASTLQSPTQTDGMMAVAALNDGRVIGAGSDNVLRSSRMGVPGSPAASVTDLVRLPASISRIEAYDSQRLAVASGHGIIIIDISE